MDNFFRLLFIWSMPVTISIAVVTAVRYRLGVRLGNSSLASAKSGLRRNLDPFFSLLLPIVLLLIHHPFMLAFPRQQSSNGIRSNREWRRYQALGNFSVYALLTVICTLLFAVAINTQPQTGMPGLTYYWPKAGIFFNVTMGLMHLLPWPPFLLGTILVNNRLADRISDRAGIIAGAVLILAIPANYGYGHLVFPVYHWLCAVAGL
jgi:hypothetical protein